MASLNKQAETPAESGRMVFCPGKKRVKAPGISVPAPPFSRRFLGLESLRRRCPQQASSNFFRSAEKFSSAFLSRSRLNLLAASDLVSPRGLPAGSLADLFKRVLTMAYASARSIRWLLVTGLLCLPTAPLAAQDRYLRLDDGLYELNADGTYHKVQGSTATSPRPSSSPSRPATTSSSGRYTGQERFMRFDDGLYERMADGTYTKVDERRQTQYQSQSQSQSGRYGASSTSMDPEWQQDFGRQQWSNNSRPQQWNNQSQQWSNNGRPQQWNNRPQQSSNQNQQAARELGILLNVLGGVIQNGNGNSGGRQPNFQPSRPSFQPSRPSFQPSRPSFQPQPNFQTQNNFQPQPVPQAPPRPVPAPSQPPKPSPRPPVTNSYIQQGGNQSGFNLGAPDAR